MKNRSPWSAWPIVVLASFLAAMPISSAQAAAPVPPVFGYIGPGAGLGFLGSLLAILMVVFLGLVGLILYPLKLCIRWVRSRTSKSASAAGQSNSMLGSERA